jgi:hypothetical protein
MRDCTIGSSADNTGDGILLCGPAQVPKKKKSPTERALGEKQNLELRGEATRDGRNEGAMQALLRLY